MGSGDALDGFQHAVIYGVCLFSSIIDVLGFCVSKHSVLREFSTLFRHLRVSGGAVRGKPPRLRIFLTVAA